MTGLLCILLCAALLYFEVSYCRLQREVRSLSRRSDAPCSRLRHLSPHRRAVDEKRRTNG